MNLPEVSVILPTYNGERYVTDAIRSVLMQKRITIELIIINDASKDNTENVLRQFLNDKRIKYYKLPHNSGVANARNIGIDHATGAYIAFIDDDDVWKNDKLARQIDFMKKSSLNFSYAGYTMIDENGTFLKNIGSASKTLDYKHLLLGNSIPLLTVVIGRKFLSESRFQNIHHEDFALWLNLWKRSDIKAACFPEEVAYYRVRRGSTSANKFRSMIWVWWIYRQEEGLSVSWSLKNIIIYIIMGIVKHQRVFGKRLKDRKENHEI